MLRYSLRILLSSSILFSCTNETSSNEQKTSSNRSQESLRLDSVKIIQLAANDILKNLDTYKIVQSGFDNYGNYKIVFHEESTISEMEDLIHEYYSLEKSSLRIGDLNGDGNDDFAIESIWGPSLGNMYSTNWHIYIWDNDKWKKMPHNFYGGKGQSSESIISIGKGVLHTEFRAFDTDTYHLSDSIEKRTYKYKNQELVLNSTAP